jgi:hypothetical protein
MQPKMPEQLLCESTNIVIARVVKAAQDPQCFEPSRRQADCAPDYGGPLTIQVEQVLGQDKQDPSFPSHRKLKRGDVIVVWTWVLNDLRAYNSNNDKFPEPGWEYISIDPPTGLALSDQIKGSARVRSRSLLVGKLHLFQQRCKARVAVQIA